MEFNELSPQMKGAKTRLLNQLEKRLKTAALQMEGRSKNVQFSRFKNSRLRMGRGGGRLRQSIAGRYAVIDGKPTAILQAGGQFRGEELEYARYIEFGTPDPPTPRLVFFGEENGKKQFRYVRRGIKPRFYLKRSIEIQQKEIKRKV